MAQFSTTIDPPVRPDAEWIIPATISLPAPGGPVISTRLLVGATFLIADFSCEIPVDVPIRSSTCPTLRRSSSFSLLSRAVSMARLTIGTSRSDLNGFSMKS